MAYDLHRRIRKCEIWVIIATITKHTRKYIYKHNYNKCMQSLHSCVYIPPYGPSIPSAQSLIGLLHFITCLYQPSSQHDFQPSVSGKPSDRKISNPRSRNLEPTRLDLKNLHTALRNLIGGSPALLPRGLPNTKAIETSIPKSRGFRILQYDTHPLKWIKTLQLS